MIERGDHDHRDMLGARLGFQPTADLEAVHAGHHHIEQHHIGALVGTDLERLTAAPGGADVEILRGQPCLEQFDIGVDVVDHEDACGHGTATGLRR